MKSLIVKSLITPLGIAFAASLAIPASAQERGRTILPEHSARLQASATHGAATTFHTTTVDGMKIFYREAGDPSKPTILLLHGFPASSHMFRDLMPLLAGRFHLIAPDYPGFGYSDAPAPEVFTPTFDSLATVMEHFVEAQKLSKFSLYMQDFGGPVGFRLAVRHPEWIKALIIQNANAYDEGLAPAIREGNLRRATMPSTEAEMSFELGPGLAHLLYQNGARKPNAMNPDAWTTDLWCMGQPGHRRIGAALINNYHTNMEQYAQWQDYLRKRQPRTLVVWGKGDPVFLPAGATAYKKDLKNVEVHLLDTSHFALEEDATTVADDITAFLAKN